MITLCKLTRLNCPYSVIIINSFMTQTTLPERVLGWTEKYCDSLMENYRLQYPDSSSDRKYEIKSGSKYHKVVASDLQTNGERWSQGVHAFVDKNTGEVYKPASWKSPAQYVRFDMRIINQREQLHNPRFTDWAGGHLYLR